MSLRFWKQLLFSGTERPDTQIPLSQQPMTHTNWFNLPAELYAYRER